MESVCARNTSGVSMCEREGRWIVCAHMHARESVFVTEMSEKSHR